MPARHNGEDARYLGISMVDTTNTIGSSWVPQPESAEAGVPASFATDEHRENGPGDPVRFAIQERVCGPCDKVLADGPYLGDLFDALAAGRDLGNDAGV